MTQSDGASPEASPEASSDVPDGPATGARASDRPPHDPPPDPEFEALLEFLKEARGFDFTGYKRSSLRRRVERRMQHLGVVAFTDYLDVLQVDQDEFTHLFNTVLINVTSFLRDPEAWRELQNEVVPRLLAPKTHGEPVRVWSAGCASGEEAYGLAMVLAEALGPEEFRERVKIYATDVDDDALATARQAAYSQRDLEAVPEEWRERYFERVASQFVFRADLRRSIIFGRNDLVQDAPIGRLDLLVCRNTLMYLNAQTQNQVLNRFHFALNSRGVLFLGKAEMLLSHTRLFAPTDLKRRFFRKADAAGATARYSFNGAGAREPDAPPVSRVDDQALLSSPLATVVVGADEMVASSNYRADAQLGVTARDMGRRFVDLDVVHRVAGLRSAYEDVRRHGHSASIREIEWSRTPTETLYFDVQFDPLGAEDGTDTDTDSGPAVAVFFTDVTRYRRLTGELQQAHRQVETAYEELQSTVEELETTNEELQSTNEELETMNEELQSTNDELQSMNDELRERTDQLDSANDFLESILGSLRSAVIVVDTEFMIRAWNGRAGDLWGLRTDEVVGQHLLNLDIGLQIERLRPLVRDALGGGRGRDEPLRLDGVNRRGRPVTLRIDAAPLTGREDRPTGAIIMMEQEEPASA